MSEKEDNEINNAKKAADKKLTETNAMTYSPKNILKSRQYTTQNGDKIKIHEETTYKNGCIKSKIVGMKKKGKIIWNGGIK